MKVEAAIREKLTGGLSPSALVVENESANHSVPPGSETHFRIVVVSDVFEGLSLVDRHRRVHGLLGAELKGGVHALNLRTLTPAEAAKKPEELLSPPCLGGSKAG